MSDTDKSKIANDFRRVLRGFAATVNIVSTRDGFSNYGMTATSVTSVSMDPPSLLLAVNERSVIHPVLCKTDKFCINILGSGQSKYSTLFGTPCPMSERFEFGDWRLSPDDIPYLADAQANIFCNKVEAKKFGTHTILIGEVFQLAVGETFSPLVYLDGRYVSLEQG